MNNLDSQPNRPADNHRPTSSRTSRPFSGGWVFFIIMVIAYYRHGIEGAAVALRVLACIPIVALSVGLVVVAFGWFYKRWTPALSITALATFAVLFVAVGSDNHLRDLIAVCVAAPIALLAYPSARSALRSAERPLIRWSWLLVLPGIVYATIAVASWCAIALADRMFFRSLPVSPMRFQHQTGPESVTRDLRIGACLSGGGYRAALLHSGVVAQLEELGVPIHCISAVSGGSIFAAYYSRGGKPADFVEVVSRGRFNLKRQLLMPQNLLRLPFPFTVPITKVRLFGSATFSRRDVQANLLDKLFLHGELVNSTEQALQQSDQFGIPRVILGTTDLIHGWQVGIAKEGFLVSGLKRAKTMIQPDNAAKLRYATAVSISGAFPGAFPAEKVLLENSGLEGERVELLLADGGVYDNLGYRMMLAARDMARGSRGNRFLSGNTWDAKWDVDLIIVSNGGQMFDLTEVSGLRDELSRVIGLLGDLPAARQEEAFREGNVTNSTPTVEAVDTVFVSPGLLTGSPDDWLYGLADRRRRTQISLLGLGDGMMEYLHPEIVLVNRAGTNLNRLLALYPNQLELMKAVEMFDHPPPVSSQTANSRGNKDDFDVFGHPPSTPQSRQRRELASRVVGMILSDIDDCLTAFRRTGTLNDHPNAMDAQRIHRLGRYLMLLKWDELKAKIPVAVTRREQLERGFDELRKRSDKLLEDALREADEPPKWIPGKIKPHP